VQPGAAVFVDSMLVGVVVMDPANFVTDRLSATPVTLLTQVSGAAKLLEDAGVEVKLEPAPQIDGVKLPRRQRLPPPGRRSPSKLLRPEYAVVPFRGRQAELETRAHRCAAAPAPLPGFGARLAAVRSLFRYASLWQSSRYRRHGHNLSIRFGSWRGPSHQRVRVQ
jgi:hypothetical protein